MTINYYKRQGVTILPGATRPLIGNIADFLTYKEQVKASKYPLPHFEVWLI